LGGKRDSAAGEILFGNYEQLQQYLCAGFWRKFGGVHISGGEQRNSGERDGRWNVEQWDHDPGGQSDGSDDYVVGDSLGVEEGSIFE